MDVAMKRKVAIVGMGAVGSATAFAFMMDGCLSELALIDVNKEKAEGNALDLKHCTMFTQLTHISAGDSFELVQDADIVVIAAGIPQKPGETRLDLVRHNAALFEEMVPKIAAVNKECILLVVTNPLDVMTYAAWRYSGLDSCKVFGTGTVLDTARLRYFIGRQYKVAPGDVNAFVLGEHGDSSFVWWNKASIAGIALKHFTGYQQGFEQVAEEEVRKAAYTIIQKKGATSYAIALTIVKIVRSILFNEPRIFTVSSIVHNRLGISDIALSLPTVIRRNGVCEILEIELTSHEMQQLHQSAAIIKKSIDQIFE